ncbi:MAG: alpha/beta hydrolase [Pseudomonadota bacterium]
MPVANIAGAAIHYQREGNGPPLVLVHGVGSDLDAWDGVIASLDKRYTVVRVDLRGHGQSEKTPGPYTLNMLAGDVLGLLDFLQIEVCVLAGFSLGGLIAQRLALDAPARIEKLVLISTVANRNETDRENVRARATRLKEEGALEHLANAVDRWFTDDFRRKHPDILERRRQKSLQNDPECYVAAYQVLATNDLIDELPSLQIPTLAMTGENDIGSPPRMSEAIARVAQNGQCHIFPHLKHSVLLEAPDLVAAQMSQFLSR